MSAGATPSWSIGGGPGSLSYRLFDLARNALNTRLARRLYRASGAAPDGPLATLEAGSGPGYCSSRLRALGPRVRATALDLDADALALVAARDRALGIVRGDLYALPFRTGAFDLVFNSSTMEHLDAFSRALREMVRVARPGGRVFVGVPYRYGPFFPFALLPREHPVAVWIGELFGGRRLREVCRMEGVAVEDTHRYFFGCFIGVTLVKERP